MIDRDVPIYLVKILCYWYQRQEMIVQWGSCLSNAFFVTNGARQGGILSPKFFNIYIDGLSDILNKSTIGGSIGAIVSIICYMQMTYVLLVYLQQIFSNYLYNVMIRVKTFHNL